MKENEAQTDEPDPDPNHFLARREGFAHQQGESKRRKEKLRSQKNQLFHVFRLRIVRRPV